MRLTHDDALARLAGHHHAVLATVHATRGVDLVPVVFALDAEGHVGIPVDTVKPKQSKDLQRITNLEADPRASLLAEHWDDDWSRLWWVRAELRWEPEPTPELIESLSELLAGRYVQYRDRPFARVLVLRMVGLSGWSAE
ncbi:MAG: pyridoxamine 5'-phosphate oxidase family protein [Ilumatobacteraceae bacterium]